MAIAASPDGSLLAATTFGDYIYTGGFPNTSVPWSKMLGSGMQRWNEIAVSDGGCLLASGWWPPGLFISRDYGATWNEVNVGDGQTIYWSSVAASTDFTRLAAASQVGVYTSAKLNGGDVWALSLELGTEPYKYVPLAVSSNGMHLVTANDIIYTSSNGGADWTPRSSAGSYKWQAIACSGDGRLIVAAPTDERWAKQYRLRWSADGGASWKWLSSIGGRAWADVAVSQDGSKVATLTYDSEVLYSSDNGTSWTAHAISVLNHPWSSLAMSGDGKLAVCSQNGYILASVNGAASWSELFRCGRNDYFEMEEELSMPTFPAHPPARPCAFPPPCCVCCLGLVWFPPGIT